jgi:hypothetical protein
MVSDRLVLGSNASLDRSPLLGPTTCIVTESGALNFRNGVARASRQSVPRPTLGAFARGRTISQLVILSIIDGLPRLTGFVVHAEPHVTALTAKPEHRIPHRINPPTLMTRIPTALARNG